MASGDISKRDCSDKQEENQQTIKIAENEIPKIKNKKVGHKQTRIGGSNIWVNGENASSSPVSSSPVNSIKDIMHIEGVFESFWKVFYLSPDKVSIIKLMFYELFDEVCRQEFDEFEPLMRKIEPLLGKFAYSEEASGYIEELEKAIKKWRPKEAMGYFEIDRCHRALQNIKKEAEGMSLCIAHFKSPKRTNGENLQKLSTHLTKVKEYCFKCPERFRAILKNQIIEILSSYQIVIDNNDLDWFRQMQKELLLRIKVCDEELTFLKKQRFKEWKEMIRFTENHPHNSSSPITDEEVILINFKLLYNDLEERGLKYFYNVNHSPNIREVLKLLRSIKTEAMSLKSTIQDVSFVFNKALWNLKDIKETQKTISALLVDIILQMEIRIKMGRMR